MSSFWRNFHHWLHGKLSFWQLSVQPVTKFSSLAAREVVILTTFGAASDEIFIKMKTFPFQCSSPAICIWSALTLRAVHSCVHIWPSIWRVHCSFCFNTSATSITESKTVLFMMHLCWKWSPYSGPAVTLIQPRSQVRKNPLRTPCHSKVILINLSVTYLYTFISYSGYNPVKL